MISIEDWRKEAGEQMSKYTMKDSEKFNFWHGFSSGLDNAEFVFKNLVKELSKQLTTEE